MDWACFLELHRVVSEVIDFIKKREMLSILTMDNGMDYLIGGKISIIGDVLDSQFSGMF